MSFIVSAVDGADPNPDVECRPASGSVFAIGTTEVTCTATDQTGHASSGRFAVTVLAAREQLVRLVNQVVAASSLPAGVKAQLRPWIEPLLVAFDRNDPADRRLACTGLNAFTAVLRLAGRSVPPALAAEWLAEANRIRAVLRC